MEEFPYDSKASAEPAWDTIGVTRDGTAYILGYEIYANDFTCIGYMFCLELAAINGQYVLETYTKVTQFIGVKEFAYYKSV